MENPLKNRKIPKKNGKITQTPRKNLLKPGTSAKNQQIPKNIETSREKIENPAKLLENPLKNRKSRKNKKYPLHNSNKKIKKSRKLPGKRSF